jgi:glycosyltransferase involved in cell wall biosynthesis
MRVLHVHSGNLYGGVETVLATLARSRGLCAEMEQEFALCFTGAIADQLTSAGVRVHQLGPVRMRYPLSMVRARRKLREVIARGAFDIAICHMAWAHAMFAATAREAALAEVLWLHDAYDGAHWLSRWAGRLAPDLIIANSSFTAATWSDVFPEVETRVIFNPVAPATPRRGFDRAALRRAMATDEAAVVIVQASRLESWKGQAALLRALAVLRDDPKWTCWLVGGAQRAGEQRYLETLEALAKKLEIGARVRFAGQRGDVAELLAAADIHCQPNLAPEPFGIALVEALYSGLPVVTSGFGGAAEIVNEKCGILVPSGRPDELAAALETLISDPDTRARLGAEGRRRAGYLCDPAAQMNKLAAALAQLTLAPAPKEAVTGH